MGYYVADGGQYIVGDHQVLIKKTADARALGIGMVYQHFTLVPNMTVAENLVMSRDDVPMVVDWKRQIRALEAFMESMPFRIKLSAPVRSLAAGERQKLE
jgi:simple sugar transport system ATP-binding protein